MLAIPEVHSLSQISNLYNFPGNKIYRPLETVSETPFEILFNLRESLREAFKAIIIFIYTQDIVVVFLYLPPPSSFH